MATFGQSIQFGPRFRSGSLVSTLHVYHYTAGTTTLLDVYTDRAKTTTAAQPVVSDANGVVEFFADGVFKFVLKDGSDDTTIDTLDNYNVADASGALSGEGATITAASTLTLGTDGNQFHVAGSTGITALSGTQPEVTLIFDSTPTLTHSGSLILVNGVNYTAIAGDVIKFMNEGSGVWRELTRWNDALAGYAQPLGSNGTIPIMRSGDTDGLAYVSALTKHIHGLTYSNGTDATNDIDFAAGGCMDSTGVIWITCAAMAGKQLDAGWAPGAAAGMRNSGAAITDTDYYLYAVAKADGTQDYYAHTSTTVATVITALQAESGGSSYLYARIIGWIKRVGGTIVAFDTYETEGGGLELRWDSPTLDINLANTLTTSRRTDAVKVPLNFSTIADLNVRIEDASATTQNWIYCPDHADLAPSSTAAPLGTSTTFTAVAVNSPVRIRTSATGTIAARSTVATADLYAVVTLGFTWARRN